MGETTLEFVHGLGVPTEAVHEQVGTWDANLAGISGMLNARGSQGVLLLLVIAPSEPLDGHVGVVDGVLPTTDGFTGNAVRDHAVHA